MEPIAIIGFSFKLPQGVTDESNLWEMLESGQNMMTEWPKDRVNIDALYDGGSRKHNTLYARGGHFISQDPATFDAPFFSITTKEADAMDPQQRWALETSFHAFENAGIPLESLKGSKTGVFASSMSYDYSQNLFKDPDTGPRMAATGIASSIIANRLSWHYGLLGPSMHIDTACSGSLVALDIACQSLRTRDSSMASLFYHTCCRCTTELSEQALVVGTNLMLAPDTSIALANMNFLSPDSRCWSFDKRANGYGRGEGIIALLLKPVSQAIADGDAIRAVIRASGVNQDGHTPGLTSPSTEAQELLIRSVYNKAKLDFESTRYVEAHGTGTPVGDPIEMKAIGNVFRLSRSSREPLYVGSIKANIGHLEASSGLAGIVKCILILEKGIIPQNASFGTANPDLDLDFLNTQIPTVSIPWPSNGTRRISLNSFGFGGTNAHVILEDAAGYMRFPGQLETCAVGAVPHSNHNYADVTQSAMTANPELPGHTSSDKTNGNHGGSHACKNQETSACTQLLVLSAANEKALNRMIDLYQECERDLCQNSGRLQNLAHTLNARRTQMSWRSFSIASSFGQPSASQPWRFEKPTRSSNNNGLGFLFTGQGAQYSGMGKELLQYATFRNTLKDIDRIFCRLGSEWSLFDELNGENIHQPEYSQPLCTAVQIAMVDLLQFFGLKPRGVVGHSSGEIAAAYAVGALSLESACRVAYYRGQCASKLKATSRGAMMAVNLRSSQIATYLEGMTELPYGDHIEIACFNSPSNCTLSGAEVTIDKLKALFEEQGIFAQKLNTGVAYHSKAMLEVSDYYLRLMGTLDADPSNNEQATFISTVSGHAISKTILSSASYWVENLLSPVQFTKAMENLTATTEVMTDLIEIGPHPALRRPVNDLLDISHSNIGKRPRYHPLLLRSKSALQTSMSLFGQLFCHGHPVDIKAVNEPTGNQTRRPRMLLSDCPSYPFETSLSFWSEPRMSRDSRVRADAPCGSLLGRRFHDWNPLEPRWRNFLSVESIPWLADHVIGGATLFPAAGMLAMAMAAVMDISPRGEHIQGFFFQEASFLQPVVVGETIEDATETMLRLKPIKRSFDKTAAWSDITIFTHHDGRWSECFQARVQVEFSSSITEPHTKKERRLRDQKIVDNYDLSSAVFGHTMQAREFYEICHDLDHGYGAAFQLLDEIRLNKSNTASLARVHVSSASSYQSVGPPHPTVLDAVIQLAVAPISKSFRHTLVPHKLSNTWIAADGWSHLTTSSLRLSSTVTYEDNWQHIECGGTVLTDSKEVLCKMDKLRMAFLATNGLHSTGMEGTKLLHSIEWLPQLSLMSLHQVQSFCGLSDPTEDQTEMVEKIVRLDRAAVLAVGSAMDHLTRDDLVNVPPSLQKYTTTIQYHLQDSWLLEDKHTGIEKDIDALLLQCTEELPGLALYPIVCGKLPLILRGHLDPKDLFFTSQAQALHTLYKEVFRPVCDDRLRKFLMLAAHENPNLRIIEVGAGTGGLTGHVLGYLGELENQTGTSRFAEYVYTDISAAFFDQAREKFHDFETRMEFRTFDLKRDIPSQGLPVGVFDIVIAGSVIHATPCIGSTLCNVRKLLKPGGRLVNLEMVATRSPVLHTVFGTLPDWWIGTENFRAHTPLLNEDQWDQISRNSGFSGNDVVFRDRSDPSVHTASLIITTAVESPQQAMLPLLSIIVDKTSMIQQSMAEQIALNTATKILSVTDANSSFTTEDSIVVSLLDIGSSSLAGMCKEDFDNLQRLILSQKNLLWVSTHWSDSESPPYFGMISGFLRTLRSEAADRHIVSLHIETSQNLSALLQTDFISQVLAVSFQQDSSELEFIVRDGCLLTGRLVEEVTAAANLSSFIHPQLVNEQWACGQAVKLAAGTPGDLESLRFIDDNPFHHAELHADEIEIEAKAWALSFRDVFIALARLEGESFGFECTGIVTRLGSNCKSGPFQTGDRVCLTSVGSMRRFPRAPSSSVFMLPTGTSFAQGVSAISPGVTAYYALVELARLKPREKVLIHSCAGGTGQMAFWIAKMIGAEIFATVGQEDKKQFLMNLGLPEDHIFYSRNPSFAEGIMRVTNGVGVDVVLNSLSGEGLQASWGCIAPFGRFIEIGKTDMMENSPLPMSGFARNVSFLSVDLHHMAQARPHLVTSTTEALMDLLACGKLRYPSPLHEFPVSNIESAFRYMQTGRNSGRIIITIDDKDIVPKFVQQRDDWRLDPNASYLIAGGLGGLGRSISQWMVKKGARSLILPSRSGVRSDVAKKFVHDMRNQGISVSTPSCDASNIQELCELLQDCARTLPAIKGCINAAMDLQDAVFDNMSYQQWTTSIRSKVHSTWNLHTLLPTLDFFVLLSSLSGILGSVSQANYAAGCAFQDSLAQLRASRGQRAVSIDVGWMKTVGAVAESHQYENHRRNVRDMIPLEEEELLALLSLCCQPPGSGASLGKSQIALGLVTPKHFLERGEIPIDLVKRPLFSTLARPIHGTEVLVAGSGDDIPALFRLAANVEEKAQLFVKGLSVKLARALAVDVDDVQPGRVLSDYGVDSLMAVELRKRIKQEFLAVVAVFDIMGSKTLEEIGHLVVERAQVNGGK